MDVGTFSNKTDTGHSVAEQRRLDEDELANLRCDLDDLISRIPTLCETD